MNCISQPVRAAGFALMEALLALLLLAVAVGGAGSALVESLAGQRSAQLRTRAADLAADMAEALRATPDAASLQTEIALWQALVQQQLPGGASQVLVRPQPSATREAMPAGFDIQLQWRDGRMAAPAQLQLPIALAPAGS
jgi:Tfp pilus assembly protein PilV